ncbi:MAG: GIY-YIG nuclease family protein [Woeseiaceae bacterium]
MAEKFGVSQGLIRSRRGKGWTWEQAVGIEPYTFHRSDAILLTIDGKTYDAAEAARVFRVPGSKAGHKVRKRLSAGWTDRQAVGLDPPPRLTVKKARQKFKGKDRLYPIPEGSGTVYLITNTVNGRLYVGITASTFKQRKAQYRSAAKSDYEQRPVVHAMRKYGFNKFKFEVLDQTARTYPELLDLEEKYIKQFDTYRDGYNATRGGESGGRAIEIGGVEYPSVSVAALAHDIDPGTFVSRLNRGMPPEIAVDFVYRKTYTVTDPVHGEVKGNLTELCDRYDIPFMRAYQRLEAGWTIEEVVGLAEHKHLTINEPVAVSGHEFKNFRSACDEYQVSYKKAWRRLNERGWTVEQALGVESPPSRAKHGGQRVQVGRRIFRTKTAAAKALGISYEKLMKRITDGTYELIEPDA